MSPSLQLRYVFDLRVSLQHHQVVLRHNKVDIDHLLAHLPSLLSLLSHHELNLLLAGEHSAVSIVQPDQHIIVEVQVETP